MKRAIALGTIAITVMFAVAGCGKKDNAQKPDSAQTASAAVKKVDIAAKKKAFEAKIASWSQYGLEANKTKETQEGAHYLIEVKDASKATQAILAWLNAGNAAQRDRKPLVKLIKNIKRVGVDVDWKKYAQNQPKSVFIYLAGTPSLMQEKKQGAYLTYDAKDTLTEVDVKDIDETTSLDGNRTFKMTLKGAKALIVKMPTAENPASKIHLTFGTFTSRAEKSYAIDANMTATKTSTLSYSGGSCDTDKSNRYLGEITCTLPSITIGMTKRNKAFTLKTEDVKFTTLTTEKNNKVQSKGSFEIGKIKLTTKSYGKPSETVLSQLKLKMDASNMDPSLFDALSALSSMPQKDENQTIVKTMKILGDMFSGGMNIDYAFSIASIAGHSGAAGKGKKFAVDAIDEQGKVSFTKTYDFRDMLKIKNINVSDEASGKTVFELQGLRYGSQVANLYNFLPGFFEFSGSLAQHPDEAEPTAEEKKKLLDIGMKMVHNGFSMAYSPVSIEKIKIDEAKVDYGKMQLDLNATLKPNNAVIANAMSAMQLLAFLQADGKLVLNEADLKSMSNSFSPKVMAMVMMFAKYEGGKAVFVLKFDKGHLFINGKPVM